MGLASVASVGLHEAIGELLAVAESGPRDGTSALIGRLLGAQQLMAGEASPVAAAGAWAGVDQDTTLLQSAPSTTLASRVAGAAASAAQTASSAAHQLDLRLRKTTSELMRRLAALPAAQRGALARVLSELKKQVLLRRKERWVQRGAPGELDEELEAASDELHAAFGLVDLEAARST